MLQPETVLKGERGREWQQHRNGRKGERRRMKKELGTWSKFFFISDIIIIQRLVFSSYLPSLLPISDITFWSTILQARNIDWMGCEFMHLLFHDYPKFFWIQFQVVLKKLSFGIKFLPLHFFISFLLFISVTFLSCIMLCLQWEKCPTMTSRIPRSGLIIHFLLFVSRSQFSITAYFSIHHKERLSQHLHTSTSHSFLFIKNLKKDSRETLRLTLRRMQWSKIENKSFFHSYHPSFCCFFCHSPLSLSMPFILHKSLTLWNNREKMMHCSDCCSCFMRLKIPSFFFSSFSLWFMRPGFEPTQTIRTWKYI